MGGITSNYLKGVAMLPSPDSTLEHHGVKGMKWGIIRKKLRNMSDKALMKTYNASRKKYFDRETSIGRIRKINKRRNVAALLGGPVGPLVYDGLRLAKDRFGTKYGMAYGELKRRAPSRQHVKALRSMRRDEMKALNAYNNPRGFKRTDGLRKDQDYFKPKFGSGINVYDKVSVNRKQRFGDRLNELSLKTKAVKEIQRQANAKNGGKRPKIKKSRHLDFIY